MPRARSCGGISTFTQLWSLALSLAFSGIGFSPSCHAEHYAWTLDGIAEWNSTHWMPAGVPGPTDDAFVLQGRVQVLSLVTVKSLALEAGLFGSGTLEVSSNLFVGRASLLDALNFMYTNDPSGPHEFKMLGESVFNPGDFAFVNGINISRKMINHGRASFFEAWIKSTSTPYRPITGHGASWENKSGSELEFFGTNLFTYGSSPPQQRVPIINEVGAVIRKIGPEPVRVEWQLHNDGSIIVEDGSLHFQAATRLNGPMTVAQGAFLVIEPYEPLSIGPQASFNGAGTIALEGSQDGRFDFEGAQIIDASMTVTNAIIGGEALTFIRPMFWTYTGATGTTWVGTSPVQFLMGGMGKGTVYRPMINLGPLIDVGINSQPGASFVNIPPGNYFVTNNGDTPFLGQGWFTNLPLAWIHFQGQRFANDPSLRWNLFNQGQIRFDRDCRARVVNSFIQASPGQTTFNSNSLVVSNMVLGGLLTGSGNLTCYHAQVTGVLSPAGLSGPFGRLNLASTGGSQFGVQQTNRIVLTPATILEVDLGAPNTTNDYFFIGSVGGSGQQILAGQINIRAQAGFAPGQFRFLRYGYGSPIGASNSFRFGSVPPGYRFSLATNTAGQELVIVVTQPAFQTVSLQGNTNGSPGFALNIRSLTNTPYSIHFTDDLVLPWQPWSNFIGNGQLITLPVSPTTPARFFRVTEGQ